MKKSEMKKLLAEYDRLKDKSLKRNIIQKHKILEKISEIEHRYYHETGSKLKNNS